MPKALVDEMIAKEYMGSGKASMEDKVMRREERSLGSTLTPKAYPPKPSFGREGKPSFGSVQQRVERRDEKIVPSVAAPRPPKEQVVHERKPVNIDDLKKAIEESLQKRKESEKSENSSLEGKFDSKNDNSDGVQAGD